MSMRYKPSEVGSSKQPCTKESLDLKGPGGTERQAQNPRHELLQGSHHMKGGTALTPAHMQFESRNQEQGMLDETDVEESSGESLQVQSELVRCCGQEQEMVVHLPFQIQNLSHREQSAEQDESRSGKENMKSQSRTGTHSRTKILSSSRQFANVASAGRPSVVDLNKLQQRNFGQQNIGCYQTMTVILHQPSACDCQASQESSNSQQLSQALDTSQNHRTPVPESQVSQALGTSQQYQPSVRKFQASREFESFHNHQSPDRNPQVSKGLDTSQNDRPSDSNSQVSQEPDASQSHHSSDHRSKVSPEIDTSQISSSKNISQNQPKPIPSQLSTNQLSPPTVPSPLAALSPTDAYVAVGHQYKNSGRGVMIMAYSIVSSFIFVTLFCWWSLICSSISILLGAASTSAFKANKHGKAHKRHRGSVCCLAVAWVSAVLGLIAVGTTLVLILVDIIPLLQSEGIQLT